MGFAAETDESGGERGEGCSTQGALATLLVRQVRIDIDWMRRQRERERRGRGGGHGKFLRLSLRHEKGKRDVTLIVRMIRRSLRALCDIPRRIVNLYKYLILCGINFHPRVAKYQTK